MRMKREWEEAWSDEHWTDDVLAEALAAQEAGHPVEASLRTERLPHIWCPGCGIGTAMGTFVKALKEAEVDPDRLAVVSGIGCSGRVSGYMKADSFHTVHGRAVPFATGLHLANPDLEVVVFSGDGDLMAIGGNHLIHAARRNVDLTVLCVNNFIYGMTGGQFGPTSLTGARSTTSPYGNIETPFNLPRMLASAGATYVARYTILDLGRLRRAMVEALHHPGFAFVEIVSPCPIYFGRFNKIGEAVDQLKQYHERTEVRNFAPLDSCGLDGSGPIVVGTFVQTLRPTLLEQIGKELPERARARATARK
jgi:2-oxoglutarate ferredoxin oxidoreductase subunit beta